MTNKKPTLSTTLPELRRLAGLLREDRSFASIDDGPQISRLESAGLIQVLRPAWGLARARLLTEARRQLSDRRPLFQALCVEELYREAGPEEVLLDLERMVAALKIMQGAWPHIPNVQGAYSYHSQKLIYLNLLPEQRSGALPQRGRDFLAMASASHPIELAQQFKNFHMNLSAYVAAANLVLDCGMPSRLDLAVASRLGDLKEDLRTFWRLVWTERRYRSQPKCRCQAPEAA